MLGAFEIFRIRFGGRPLLLCLCAFAFLLLVRRVSPRRFSTRHWSALAVLVAATAALGALVAYPSVAIWYASDPHFFDNAEPVIPAVGWLFHAGRPVYHSLDSPERYAHIYGPFAFIAHGWALGLLGPGIRVSKGLGVTAGLASIVLVYLLARRHVRRTPAFVLT